MTNPILEQRAKQYAALRGITLNFTRMLGYGQDGSVWRSNRQTAVKALEREKNYRDELECYRRFQRHKVTKLHGFSIPQLIAFNDDLQIIEMRIVTAPFLLDFGKVWLDRAADFSPETMEDWNEAGVEMFESKWPEVQSLLASLTNYGIYYYDAKPANIRFSEDD